MRKLIVLSFLSALGYSAQAITLNPNWNAGSHVLSVDSPNGDTVRLSDPVHEDRNGAMADALAAAIVNNAPSGYQLPAIQRANADYDGIADMYSLVAGIGFDAGTGRYYTGSEFGMNLLTPNANPVPENVRWVNLIHDEWGLWGTSNWIMMDAFNSGDYPFYYSPANDPSHRGLVPGDPATADNYYNFDTNLYTLADPQDWTRTTAAFLVMITGSGPDTILTIFDGVSYRNDQHQVPVPEPATMAVLGLGALALMRRRK